ncbi:MAG: EMC3/TMCO1 family protein [Candidatus Thermoplasmatota archaeon]|nr:EMC3/TMCO1 family protein [Candidatus Thermoplasmatota archaeon]MCL5730552.1 EMC3/TMCO1 family protein [Candidatus Thermoplasmatota archaeon]
MTEQQRRTPPPISEAQKKMMKMQMVYLLITFLMLIFISTPSIRLAIGAGANAIFSPIIGFGGAYPLLTIVSSGILIGLITSIPRYFFTDWVKMGEIQHRSRAFGKAIRDAYRNNERDKINKLSRMRTEVMMESQAVTMNTMKPLMVLTIFTLLIFIWLDVFIYSLPYSLFSTPWATGLNVATSTVWIVPAWIVLYMFASLTVGYFATMLIKYVDFKYRLEKFEHKEMEMN